MRLLLTSITMARPPSDAASARPPFDFTAISPGRDPDTQIASFDGRGAFGSAAVTSHTVTRSLSMIGSALARGAVVVDRAASVALISSTDMSNATALFI